MNSKPDWNLEVREPYWDYMGRRLRESRNYMNKEDMMKKEIYEMQKSLQYCYKRIIELNEKIYELKKSKSDSQQLEFNF